MLCASANSFNDRVNVLGTGVTATSFSGALAAIEGLIGEKSAHYVCVADSHCIVEARSNNLLSRAYNCASMVTADGMPLVWYMRFVGARHAQRIRGASLMSAITEISEREGFRQFYYGSSKEVLEKLQNRLKAAYPRLNIAGSYSPPHRKLTPGEDRSAVEMINAARPDIVWVALGAPKQELWMYEHYGQIKGATLIGVGAAFDFLAGTKPEASPWMQRNGLEWLFRLSTEPRRLFPRYARVVPSFALLFAWDVLKRAGGAAK